MRKFKNMHGGMRAAVIGLVAVLLAGVNVPQAFGQARTDMIRSTDNGQLTLNIPVTGTDATLHTFALQIDGTSWLSAAATGNGSGGIGTISTTWGGSTTWPTTISLPAAGTAITGTAARPLNIVRSFTDATAEKGLSLSVTALDTTSGTTAQYAQWINNAASSEALDALTLYDTADADDTVGAVIKVLNTGAGTGYTYLIDTPNLDISYAGAITGITSLSLSNSETIVNTTNGQFTLGRNDSGIVTVTAADDDATAGLTILPGGAAPFVLGGAATTSVTVTTDGTGTGEVVLPDQSIGTAEITDAAIDSTKTANTLCLAPFSVFVDPTEASATNDYASIVMSDADIGNIANNSSTTEANVDQWMAPVAGYIHSLRVTVNAAPGVGNDPWLVTVRANDGAGGALADTALACTIDEAATSCTAAGSVAIPAGALVTYSISSAGGDADPTAAAVMTIGSCWGQ